MIDKHAVRLRLEVDEGLDEPLTVIRDVVACSRAIESSLRKWVPLARAKGHSWQEVADALGVTRQSAWERFRSKDDSVDAVEMAYGAFAGRGLPTTEEMRRQARDEEAETEERKWGPMPPGTKWRS